MGISRMTAMSIANNAEHMVVTVYGPCKEDAPPDVKGKFGAAICWGEAHQHHPGMPLLSSNCVYDTAEEAKERLQAVIDELAPKADELNRKLHTEMERIEGGES